MIRLQRSSGLLRMQLFLALIQAALRLAVILLVETLRQ
jgi:hypothetical protein